MGFQRDDEAIASLRLRPENKPVLDAVESASAHGDLGEIMFRLARSTGGMRVLPMSSTEFPALVATRADSDAVVVAASGMQMLLIRVAQVPVGAELHHEEARELGPDWWWVNPFDSSVPIAATKVELQRWFTAASIWQ